MAHKYGFSIMTTRPLHDNKCSNTSKLIIIFIFFKLTVLNMDDKIVLFLSYQSVIDMWFTYDSSTMQK